MISFGPSLSYSKYLAMAWTRTAITTVPKKTYNEPSETASKLWKTVANRTAMTIRTK
jgi:hypothetical protein